MELESRALAKDQYPTSELTSSASKNIAQTPRIEPLLRLPKGAAWNLSKQDLGTYFLTPRYSRKYLVRRRKVVKVASNDSLSRLPDLCKSLVLEYLPGSDVASLRLASRSWTTIAVEGLLNIERDGGSIESGVFTLRPAWLNKNDDGLQAIASRPWMAKHVKHLKIFTSDVDLKGVEKWVQKHPLHEGLLVYQQMHKDAVLHPYEKYCYLGDVCPRLVNLEKVSIKSIEWPFKTASKEIRILEEVYVRKDWDSFVMDNIKHRANFQALDVATSSQLAILEAVGKNTNPLKALDIDLLVTDLFLRNTIMNLEEKSHLFARFEELKLGLCIPIKDIYYATVLAGLNALLGETKQLRKLDLRWLSHKFSWNHIDGVYLDRIEIWQKCFLRLKWEFLEEIRLDNLLVKECEALSAFICSHKSTLKTFLPHSRSDPETWSSEETAHSAERDNEAGEL